MWLVLLGAKSEALATFTVFQAQAKVEAKRRLNTLRTDHGSEFTGRDFIDH
jgi:hypothetical protein